MGTHFITVQAVHDRLVVHRLVISLALSPEGICVLPVRRLVPDLQVFIAHSQGDDESDDVHDDGRHDDVPAHDEEGAHDLLANLAVCVKRPGEIGEKERSGRSTLSHVGDLFTVSFQVIRPARTLVTFEKPHLFDWKLRREEAKKKRS
jgi:hypothetical protein